MASSSIVVLANAEVRDEFIIEGVERLRRGASAGDVAEFIACAVEDDPDEHTVGYGGWPNILGEVELDASFMDGATLRAGAVAALKGFRHPISIARQVMLRLPHVLLVGEGAARFASEIGAEQRDMLSPEAKAAWQQRISAITTDAVSKDTITLTQWALAEQRGSDTMNVIVRDADGNICSAVTTSGIAWKYPGRVGDSPLIGAGNYCDNRYGAAACTGLGEAAIRVGVAMQAVTLMRLGWSLEAAGREVVRQLLELRDPYASNDGQCQVVSLRVLIMDAAGNVGAFATRPMPGYKVQTGDDPQPLMREAVCPV